MSSKRILGVVVLLVAAVVLNGCVIARDITAGMDEKAQDKLADKVACKVVEKMKKECCQQAGCPKAACPKMTCTKAAEPNK